MALRAWSYRDRFRDPLDPTVEDPALTADDDTLLADPAFHAQNVYAITARTLAAFEFALGRRIEWEYNSHQLYVVPHAFAEGNAYYSREDRGLFFGYLPGPDVTVFTSLSHDIVSHETTHAIVDGLRPRFLEPGLPDQPAFHEALGDIVAMLSVFSLRELVEESLGAANAEGRITSGAVTPQAIAAGVLLGLAEQFGEAVSGSAAAPCAAR